MSALCPHCGLTVDIEPGGNCPECAKPPAASGDATLVTRLLPPDVTGGREGPAPSAMASVDAELLQHGCVRPPTRLGSRGRVGKFEIIKPLGRGGMGQVFAATEPVTGTTVALKMLRSDLAGIPRVVNAFLAEARHMYQLSHPSILKVLEVSGPDEGPFFVMPLVAGGSLDRRIRSDGIPDYGDTLTLCVQVAEGLAYAHGKGLIHRDLKPANVLLGEDDRALITDFGLVRGFLGDSMVDVDRTAPEGTPAYMSPSVAAGQAEDTRCDIYSFGATMYELLTGHPPYQERDTASVLRAVLEGPPQPIASVNPKAPAGLAAVAEWCMARELRDRYASMGDVLEDLERLKAGRAPRGPHGSGFTQKRTRRLVLSVAAALAVLAAGYAGWRARHRSPGLAATEPTSVAAYCREADDLHAAGKDGEAGTLYRAVLSQDPKHLRALIGLGAIEEARGRFFEATEFYRRARLADGSDPDAGKAMVGLLLRIGHLAPARNELENWLRTDPDNEEAKRLMEDLELAEAVGGGGLPDGPPSRQGEGPPPGAGRRPRDRPPMGRGPLGDRPPPDARGNR